MANVVVTGGSRGIGLAIAERLVPDGYTIIAVARKETKELAAAVERSAGAIYFLPFDLSETAKIRGFVRDLRERFGALYGLVNNAGIGTEGVLATMPASSIGSLVQLNTIAPILFTKYAIRSMMSEGQGRIINMSSIVASTGYSGVSVYAATKASMIGFTKSLAREVGRVNVTVNAIAPGFLDTDLTASLTHEQRQRVARRSALQRLANVHDVAEAVAFLLSDKARNITGTVLTVDAGSTA